MYCESPLKAQSHTQRWFWSRSLVIRDRSAVRQIQHVWSADVVASSLLQIAHSFIGVSLTWARHTPSCVHFSNTHTQKYAMVHDTSTLVLIYTQLHTYNTTSIQIPTTPTYPFTHKWKINVFSIASAFSWFYLALQQVCNNLLQQCSYVESGLKRHFKAYLLCALNFFFGWSCVGSSRWPPVMVQM